MSNFALKMAALFTMIIDHMGHAFIITSFRYVGRIAFPLFAFLIGEGCRHTSNIKKYLSRLLIFAFISEIPFDLLRSTRRGVPVSGFWDIIDLSAQNVFFTLFLGAFAIAAYMYAKKVAGEALALVIGLLITILCGYLADFIRADYGFIGVAIIALPAIAAELCPPERWKKFVNIGVTALCLSLIYEGQLGFLLASFVSLVLILMYNGRRGKPVRWAFYLAYPVHMLILFGIWAYLGFGFPSF